MAATLAVLTGFAGDDLAEVQAAMLAAQQANAQESGPVRAKAASAGLRASSSGGSSETYMASGDLNNVVGSGNLNFSFRVDKPFTEITSAKLEINAYDVDYPANNEHDKVYFNGTYIGRLKGVNGDYQVNTFSISPSLIRCPSSEGQTAANSFFVAVNVDNGGWVTGVGWAKLTISGETFKLTASKDDPRGIELKWTDVGDRYDVYRRYTINSGKWEWHRIYGNLPVSTCLDRNVTYGDDVHYYVVANTGAKSNEATGMKGGNGKVPTVTEVDVSELWIAGEGPYYCFLKWNDFDRSKYYVSSVSFDLVSASGDHAWGERSHNSYIWPFLPTFSLSDGDPLSVFDVSKNGSYALRKGNHGQYSLRVIWEVTDKTTRKLLDDGKKREIVCGDVKVFFNKYDSDTGIPNWLYYWPKDGAISKWPFGSGTGEKADGRFRYEPNLPLTTHGMQRPIFNHRKGPKAPNGFPPIYYLSGSCDHTYVLGVNAASRGTKINSSNVTGYHGVPVGSEEVGVKKLAAVIAHEQMHGEIANGTYGDYGTKGWLFIGEVERRKAYEYESSTALKNALDAAGYNSGWNHYRFGDYYDAIVNAFASGKFVTDFDGDGIADTDETGGRYGSWGFSNTNPDTFNFAAYTQTYATYGDNEVLARDAEKNGDIYVRGREGKDWAWPGSQIFRNWTDHYQNESRTMMGYSESAWGRESASYKMWVQGKGRVHKGDWQMAIDGRTRATPKFRADSAAALNADGNDEEEEAPSSWHGRLTSLPDISISTGSVYAVSCSELEAERGVSGRVDSFRWAISLTNETDEAIAVTLQCYLTDSATNAVAWVATNLTCEAGLSKTEVRFDASDIFLWDEARPMLYAVTLRSSSGDIGWMISEQMPCALSEFSRSMADLANDKGWILPDSVLVDVSSHGVVASGKVARVLDNAALIVATLTDAEGLSLMTESIMVEGSGTNDFTVSFDGDTLYRLARPLPYTLESLRLVEDGVTVFELECSNLIEAEGAQSFRPSDLDIHALPNSGRWREPVLGTDGLCSQIAFGFAVSNSTDDAKSCLVRASLLGTNDECVCSTTLPVPLQGGSNYVEVTFPSVQIKAAQYEGDSYHVGNILIEAGEGADEIEILHTDGNGIVVPRESLSGAPFVVSGEAVCRTGDVYKPIIVEVPIDVMRAGDISASAIVTDTNGEFVVRSETNLTFSVGSNQVVEVEFAAKDLISTGVSGPYVIHYLVLRSGYEGVEEVRIEEFREEVNYTPTLYVDATGGDDASDGISSETAKRTIQAAMEWACDGAVINVGAGDYICPADTDGETFLNVDKKVSLVATAGDPSKTRIVGLRGSSTNDVRGVYLAEGAMLAGFTITNFQMSAGGGVGVYGEGLGAVVSNCVIAGCLATHDGGGVYQCTVYDSTIRACRAQNGGGAAQSSLVRCLLDGNTATQYGGGVAYGTAANCTIRNGTATRGGGGTAYAVVVDSLIEDNKASSTSSQYGGGGVYQGHTSRCTIRRNTSGTYGGGMRQGGADNCVFFGNTASGYGGGTYATTCTNCTVVGNRAGSYGGGMYSGSAYNSIVWGNAVSGVSPSSSQQYIYGNLRNVSALYTCSSPLQAGEGNIAVDPCLLGEQYGVVLLMNGSPCIDAASQVTTNGVVIGVGETDIAGSPRVLDGRPDMGAYEGGTNALLVVARLVGTGVVEPDVTLAKSGDEVRIVATETIRPFEHFEKDGAVLSETNEITVAVPDGENVVIDAVFAKYAFHVDAQNGNDGADGLSWTTAKKTIQAAIDCALDGEKIWVARGTYDPIVTSDKAVEIEAVDGAAATVIDGGGVSRCATLATSGSMASKTNSVLVGFTLTNGHSYQGAGAFGGTLKNCVIKSNVADGSSSCYGGGTYYGAQYNCRYERNSVSATTSGYGGAAYYGTSYNCSYVDNSVSGGTDGCGGAVYYGTHYDCGLTNNTAGTCGGAAYGGTWHRASASKNKAQYGGAFYYGSVYDSAIIGNRANSDGGGAFKTTLSYCLVANNQALGGNGGGALLTEYTATRCAFAKNRAHGSGGGVYEGTCNDCGFTNNTATSNGGGAYNITANRSSFTGNSAATGGGTYNGTYNFCTLEGNTSSGEGGGAYSGTFNDSLISGNTASGVGGGLSRGTFHRSRVIGNRSYSDGGGVYNGNGYNSLIVKNKGLGNGGGTYGGYNYNCTITENWCGGNGGGTCGGYLYNTIVVDNSYPDGEYNRDGGSSYNCLTSNSGDPKFVNPAEGDYRLRVGSPCINAGNNSYANGTSDLALATRIQGGTVDIGAYEGGVEGLVVVVDPIGVGTLEYGPTIVTNGGAFSVSAQPTGRAFLHFLTNGVVSTTSPTLELADISSDVKVTAVFAHEMFVDGTTGNDGNDGLSWATAKKTIQAAIDASVEGDTIWVAEGVYAPIVARDRKLEIVSAKGPTWSIIDGGGVSCCAWIGNEADFQFVSDTRLSGFTLRNGYTAHGGGVKYGRIDNCIVENCHATGHGGGIDYSMVSNCIVRNNTAEDCGGGAVGNRWIRFRDSKFIGNLARTTGGGVHMYGDGAFRNCEFSGNIAGSNGGAMYGGMAYDSTFTGNRAATGGATYNGTFYRCTLSGNTSTGEGGGAYSGTFYDSVISNNTASGAGGGLSRSTYWRSRVAGNVAQGEGGGVYNGTGYNSLIVGNRTTAGGSGGGTSSGYTYNCTIFGNETGNYGGGTYNGYHYNSIIWGNNSNGDENHNTYGGSYYSCRTGNPKFVDSGTGDFRLRTGSPCINSGNGSYVNGSTDMAGRTRVQDGTVDVGAYEGAVAGHVMAVRTIGLGNIEHGPVTVVEGGSFTVSAQATGRTFLYFLTNGVIATTSPTLELSGISADITVTAVFAHEMFVDNANGDDANDGLAWATAKRTIQAAIDASVAGDTIWVADGVYAPIITQNRKVEIVGLNGSDKTVIDGGGAARCATLGSSPTHESSVIRGFTLRNGFSSGNAGGISCGKAFDCIVESCVASGNGGGADTTTMSNCLVRWNSASGSGGGAGIYGSCRRLTDCRFVGNTARELGGGVYGGVIDRCELSGNIAGASGGGMYSGYAYDSEIHDNRAATGGGRYEGISTRCRIFANTSTGEGGGAYSGTFYDSIVSNNTASGVGGGLSRSTFHRSRIVGNRSGSDGGGVYNGAGYNSIVAKNKANANGGGTSSGNYYNCTITENYCADQGGGTHSGYQYNSIIWNNAKSGSYITGGQNNCSGGSQYNCQTSDPKFVNAAAGDYRLRSGSSCINAGNASYVNGSLDVARRTRVVDGTVDIGAHEGAVEGFLVTLITTGGAEVSHSSSVIVNSGDFTVYSAEGARPFVGIFTNGVFASRTLPFTWEGITSDVRVEVRFQNDLYVDADMGDDAYSGLSPYDAKGSIQAAIDISIAGDIIHVADGRYAPFSSANRAIRIVGDNGPDHCFVDGDFESRCATLGGSASDVQTVIEGLTLCNGYSSAGGGCYYGTAIGCVIEDCYSTGDGGGVYGTLLRGCTLAGNVAGSNGGAACGNYVRASACLFEGNFSYGNGGGLSGGSCYDSTLDGNRALSGGGAAYGSWMRSCIMRNNQAAYGGGTYNGTMHSCLYYDNYASSSAGGAYYGTLYNCTLTRNKAAGTTGGMYYSTAYNTISRGNLLNSGAGHDYYGGSFYNCCLTGSSGSNSLFADPLFFDAAHDDFRLSMNSPCLNRGNNSYVSESLDLLRKPRTQDGTVDIGCYEGPVYIWQINVVICGSGSVLNSGTSVIDGNSLTFTAVEDGRPFLGFYTNDVFATSAKNFTWNGISANGTLEAWFEQDYYVDASRPDDSGDGLTWETARKDLAAVVAEASNGANIWVKGGTYGPIVSQNKKLLITAVDGKEVTAISGGGVCQCADFSGGSANISLQTNTVLAGFTLRNGFSANGGGAIGGTLLDCILEANVATNYGGGTYYGRQYACVYRDNVVSNNAAYARGGAAYYGTSYDCVYTGNLATGAANTYGGAIFGGTHYDCSISGNKSTRYGGGAYGGTFYRCDIANNDAFYGGGCGGWAQVRDSLVRDNTARYGAGGYSSVRFYGCTVVCNVAQNGGGMMTGCYAYNSIVWGNRATVTTNHNWISTTMYYSCSEPLATGTGNICSNPLFVDMTNGNYRLTAESPCLDAGYNGYVNAMRKDLVLRDRIQDGVVDMGCYEGVFSLVSETQTTPEPVPYAWLDRYPEMTESFGGDYEKTANSTAANGVNKVWECYVAGLNPTNATDVFRAVISMDGGKPQISWEPRLSAEEEAKRTYTVEGRESLTSGSWGPTNAASRFFRVRVEMP